MPRKSKADDSSDSEDDSIARKKTGKSHLDVQRETIEKLMSDPEREIFIPDFQQDAKLPKAFNPHEFVRNVMGASAGAGSGEFDIYRGCRNREMARQEYIQAKAEKEKAQQEFEAKRFANLAEAEKKTAKKRAKRLKAKSKLKNKKKNQEEKQSESSASDAEEIELDLNEKS